MPRRDGTWPEWKWPKTWEKKGNCEWAQHIEFSKWKWNQWCGQKKWLWNRWNILDEWESKK
jgi:hypothetical protein